MPQLRHMTWPETKRRLRKDIVLIPAGSTEQHGHHMPLGTDHLIAERLAAEVAEKLDCIVAPTIPYGISSEHRQFPGTVWISFESFRMILTDICRSLGRHGAKKIVLVNAHGGQQFAAQYIARHLRDEGIYLGVHEWWEAHTEEFDNATYGKKARHWGHGCVKETSLGLALFPEHVRMNKAKDLATNWGPRFHGGVKTLDCADFAPRGSIGHPVGSTRTMGERTFQFAVDNLAEYARHIRKTTLKKLLSWKISG